MWFLRAHIEFNLYTLGSVHERCRTAKRSRRPPPQVQFAPFRPNLPLLPSALGLQLNRGSLTSFRDERYAKSRRRRFGRIGFDRFKPCTICLFELH